MPRSVHTPHPAGFDLVARLRRVSTTAARSGWDGLLVALVLLSLSAPGRAQSPAPSLTDTTQITFDEAVRLALDRNTDVKRARADARQADTQVQAEWMDFAPDLRLSSDVSRRFGRNFSQVTGDFTTRSTDFFNLTGRSQLTLFDGFENVASLRRGRDQARARELDLKRTRRDVVFRVMEQYLALIESRETVRVRREALAARRQQLAQIKEFVDTGARPVSDLYQQQADVADAEQNLLQAQREQEVGRTRLIQTLQLDPRAAYIFSVPDLKRDTLGVAAYDLSALIDEAFRRRLDLKVAKTERRAAEHDVRAARSSYYPTLSLGANYGTDWTSRGRIPDPNNPGQFLTPSFSEQLDNNRGGGISLSLSVPLFDRFQRKTQVERAQVDVQNATYALQDRKQQVALQVRQAYFDYKNAVQQLEAATARVRAAEQARAAARERYALGAASIVELRTANSDYVEAASQKVRARYTLLVRKKEIDYHVGRLRPSASLFRP